MRILYILPLLLRSIGTYYAITVNFCKTSYRIIFHFSSDNVIQVMNFYLADETHLTLIILKNLVTWVIDNHRDSQRVNRWRALFYYGCNKTILSRCVQANLVAFTHSMTHASVGVRLESRIQALSRRWLLYFTQDTRRMDDCACSTEVHVQMHTRRRRWTLLSLCKLVEC